MQPLTLNPASRPEIIWPAAKINYLTDSGIPDIHEDLAFLNYIIAVEDTSKFDHIVMLGDYFDPPGTVNPSEDNLKRVAGTIMGMKEILGDRLHMLWGNHDLPYYTLRPVCGANKGKPNKVISNWLGNTTCERAEIINELWDEAFEDKLMVPQIVGHTRCAKETQKGRSYCIDLAQAAYAILEDGDVQLNIVPNSWLGESMLDSVES